jgi:rubrerythrin
MTCRLSANDSSDRASGPARSRRCFLTRALGASALTLPALSLASPRAEAGSNKRLMGRSAELLQEIMNDEAAHVRVIQSLLKDEDNPLPIPIRQPPKFNMDELKQATLNDFLTTAAAFENTGSGLYHGALLNITQTQEYFPVAAGLASVESRHAAWLNSLLGEALVPDFVPVEAPIDQTTVLSRVAPFVKDARSTFPSFDTTVVSDRNNFFILDFVLFLEYIEAAFYATNVPRYAALK